MRLKAKHPAEKALCRLCQSTKRLDFYGVEINMEKNFKKNKNKNKRTTIKGVNDTQLTLLIPLNCSHAWHPRGRSKV